MDFAVSDAIRARIEKNGGEFRANQNISEYLRPGEREKLQAEVEVRIGDLLRSLVIDVERDHNTRETAGRVAKMFCTEVFAGRYDPAPKVTKFPNINRVDEITVVGPISVRSACAHHFVPIMGEAFVAVIYGPELIGLSKFHRLIEWISSRPQIQEEAAAEIADVLERELEPLGLMVVVKAAHMCCGLRGVKQPDSRMVSSVVRRRFVGDNNSRAEALALMKGVGL